MNATTNLLHADIFFFISTVVFVLLAVGVLFLLVYAVIILRNISYIVRRTKEGFDIVSADFTEFREATKKEGLRLQNILKLAKRFFSKKL